MRIRMPTCDRCRKSARRFGKAMLLFVESRELRILSATKTASKLAGSLVLAFSLMLCLLPGSSNAP
jgi:hypothetical protein